MAAFRKFPCTDWYLDQMLRATLSGHAILDALSTPLVLLDRDARIVEANAAWRERAGLPDHSQLFGVVGDDYLSLCEHAAGEVSGITMVMRGLRQVLDGHLSGFERTCQMLQRGRMQYFRLRVKRVEVGNLLRFVISLKDITDLAEAQRAARELSQKVLDAETNERQRFARELHDSIGQSIVSLNLSLLRLAPLINGTEEVAVVLSDMKTAIEEVQGRIRTISYLLQPPWPEDAGGLESAAAEFVRGFARRAGLHARIRMPRRRSCIDSDRQLALFRILQEALVNVHRHALATAVSVHLADNGDEIILRVKDNGRGLNGGSTTFSPGAGILGMRARLRQFDGTLKIEGGATGTTLTARLPTRSRVTGLGMLQHQRHVLHAHTKQLVLTNTPEC